MRYIKNSLKWIKSDYLQFALIIYIVLILIVPKIPLIKTNLSVPIRVDDLLIVPLVILAIFKYLKEKNYLKLFKNPVSLIALVWLIVMAMTTVVGLLTRSIEDPKTGFLFWLRYVQYISVMWVAFIALSNMSKLKNYFFTVGGLVIPLGIYGILQRFGIVGGYGGGFYNYIWVARTDRSFASFAGPYEFAAYLVLVTPILSAILFSLRRFYQYAVWIAMFLISVLALSFTAARTPLAGVVVGINVIQIFVNSWKKRIIVFSLSMFFLIIPFFVSNTLVTRTNDLILTVDSYANHLLNSQSLVSNNSGNNSQASSSGNLIGSDKGSVVQNATHIFGKIFENETNSITTTSPNVSSSPTTPVVVEPSLKWRVENLWPKALRNFQQNPLFGGGLSSGGISVDSTYLTLLGETGLVGLIVFIILIIFVLRLLIINIKATSGIDRLLFIGFLGGLVGLLINAVFIDVFRASKIAYIFWILVGLSIRYSEFLKQHD